MQNALLQRIIGIRMGLLPVQAGPADQQAGPADQQAPHWAPATQHQPGPPPLPLPSQQVPGPITSPWALQQQAMPLGPRPSTPAQPMLLAASGSASPTAQNPYHTLFQKALTVPALWAAYNTHPRCDALPHQALPSAREFEDEGKKKWGGTVYGAWRSFAGKHTISKRVEILKYIQSHSSPNTNTPATEICARLELIRLDLVKASKATKAPHGLEALNKHVKNMA